MLPILMSVLQAIEDQLYNGEPSKYFHALSDCPDGQTILPANRRKGRGSKSLCPTCRANVLKKASNPRSLIGM